jgi:hypothetical protein
VEARRSGEHTRYITTVHNGQLAVHIGEADGTLVLRLGESGVGGFAEELHGPRTEPPEGLKRDRAECISGAVVVSKVVPALVGIPKSSGMARDAGGGTNVASSQGMDERDVGENLAGPGAQVRAQRTTEERCRQRVPTDTHRVCCVLKLEYGVQPITVSLRCAT